MPYVHVDKGMVHYEVFGNGPPIVLLHGAWASSRWWKHQVPELLKSYRVYALDIRGHGESSDLDEVSSIKAFADDLHRFVQKERVGRPVLMGWSMGGMTALQFCMDHPDSGSALILIASRAQRSRKMKTRVTMQYLHMMLGMFSTFAAPRNYDPAKAERPLSQRGLLLRSEARRMLSPEAPEELIHWVSAELARIPARNYFQIAKSIWNWEAGPGLSDIEVPTLIIVGENDTITSPEYSRFMYERIPKSKLVVLESANHYAALERPALVNKAILGFLKDIEYQ